MKKRTHKLMDFNDEGCIVTEFEGSTYKMYLRKTDMDDDVVMICCPEKYAAIPLAKLKEIVAELENQEALVLPVTQVAV